MQRVLAQTLAELLDLDLLRSAGHLDLGAVVQVTSFGALKPDVFAGFLSHDNTKSKCVRGLKFVVRGRSPTTNYEPRTLNSYSRIFDTTPEPTVLPPSRM